MQCTCSESTLRCTDYYHILTMTLPLSVCQPVCLSACQPVCLSVYSTSLTPRCRNLNFEFIFLSQDHRLFVFSRHKHKIQKYTNTKYIPNTEKTPQNNKLNSPKESFLCSLSNKTSPKYHHSRAKC